MNDALKKLLIPVASLVLGALLTYVCQRWGICPSGIVCP